MASDVQTDLAGLQEALLTTDGVEQFLPELAVLRHPKRPAPFENG